MRETVENVIKNAKADTEVIVVCDGNWPDPSIKDHPRVTLIYHPQSVGQRAATNEAARLSKAKYIMKLDAHCVVDEGFDVKLMADCEHDWTVVPRLYNLHVFDWKCKECGRQTYQGPKPPKCDQCNKVTEFERFMVMQPRWNRQSDFARFDNTLHFQYWGDYKKRPQAAGDIADLMCHVGACWFMHRDRYWELEGVDERHGSWGQMGVEVSCKTWLSGGRQVVNKKTWYSHLFRTQPGFGFPYPNPGIGRAREYSRKLWVNGEWSRAKYPLSWLLEKFWPIPGWSDEDLSKIKKGEINGFLGKCDEGNNAVLGNPSGESHNISTGRTGAPNPPQRSLPTKGIIYYTDNRCDEKIWKATQAQIKKCCPDWEIISVSLKPIDFGKNIVLPLQRSVLTMFKQILAGIEASTTDIIFFCEHDVYYHPNHFQFTPPTKELFYYDQNKWMLRYDDGHALFYHSMSTSMMSAYRSLLLEHYRKRVERVEKEGFTLRMGYEPGGHRFPRGVDNYGREACWSEFPCIDIRHGKNLTPSRWSKDQFRNKGNLHSWKEATEIPGWGETKGIINVIQTQGTR